MEFRCLSYLSKFSDWTLHKRAWATLTKQLPPPYHGLQKDWKESSIRNLSLERCSVPMPGLPISSNSPFSLEFCCLVFGHTVQPCHFLSVEELWGEGGVEDGPSLPTLLSCISGQWDVFTHDNFTVVITVTNGHPGITGRFSSVRWWQWNRGCGQVSLKSH